MRPPHQNRRLLMIGIGAVILLLGAALLLSALQQNTQFFHDPADVVADGFVAKSKRIRIGGLVKDGSIVRGQGLNTTFAVKNFEGDPTRFLLVEYDGVLPNLFREGQGVVLTGALNDEGIFVASEVLAKHDENYKPKM